MTLAPTREEVARTALQARLDDPRVAASLATLLDHADLLAVLVTSLDEFVARSEVIGDNLIDGITELRSVVGNSAAGSDIDLKSMADAGRTLLEALPSVTAQVKEVVDSGVIDRVIESGIAGPEALAALSTVARGLVEGSATFRTDPVEVGGALSLLRMLKDPDVNRSLSYVLTIAKTLGRQLAEPVVPTRQS